MTFQRMQLKKVSKIHRKVKMLKSTNLKQSKKKSRVIREGKYIQSIF